MRAIEPETEAALTPDLPKLRGQVLALEQELYRLREHEIVIQPVHYFAPGLYAREILIPKDCVCTGKIHLFGHLNIISKGDVSVMTDDGIKRIQAPATLISKPGIKRAAWAHEDTVWTTIHAYDSTETDPAKVEAALVVETYEQFALRLAEQTDQLDRAQRAADALCASLDRAPRAAEALCASEEQESCHLSPSL